MADEFDITQKRSLAGDVYDSTRPSRVTDTERKELIAALAAKEPRWITDKAPSERINAPPTPPPGPRVMRLPPSPTFPEPRATDIATAGDSILSQSYAFALVLKSIDQDAYTVKVLVTDGEINSEFPTGMTGADDYILTLAGAADGTEIWAVITYDTDTLAITSRTLDFGASVPDSIFGTFYVGIGYVDWEFAPITGAITNVVPHNRQCGDINFVLTYGDLNGVPAVIPVCAYAPLVAVT